MVGGRLGGGEQRSVILTTKHINFLQKKSNYTKHKEYLKSLTFFSFLVVRIKNILTQIFGNICKCFNFPTAYVRKGYGNQLTTFLCALAERYYVGETESRNNKDNQEKNTASVYSSVLSAVYSFNRVRSRSLKCV